MKLNILKISLYLIVFIFFGLGLLQFNTLAHEYSHYLDYKGKVNPTFICLNGIDTNITLNPTNLIFKGGGLYMYDYEVSNEQEINKIRKYTELKAYGLSILILIIGFTIFFFFLNEVLK